MSCAKKAKIKKYCSLIGAHLVTTPFTFLWVYGNLSAYMDSYFRFACPQGCMDGDTAWILGICTIMVCPGILISQSLTDKVGVKCTGVVSSIVLNAALFSSAWSVQKSVSLTAVLLGAPMGLVEGITMVVAFQYARAWAPENATFLIATTIVAPTFLSIIQNQVITAVVNPNNLSPDAIEGSRAFFSQPEVLDRVPTVLIVYAAMTLGLQAIGYLLLFPPPQDFPLNSLSGEPKIESEINVSKQTDEDFRNATVRIGLA